MKKAVCLVLCALICLNLGAVCAEAPGTQLGLQALKQCFDGTGNPVISPVSLAYALAMAEKGAEGETEAELEQALESDDADDWAEETFKRLEASGLRLANAAFLTGDLPPKKDYIEDLREDFGAEWFENEGDMVEIINQWVAEKTDGQINRMLDEPLAALSQLVLINAIAMDAKWTVPFDASDTQEETFHAPDGDVAVPMMYNELYADYAEEGGVQKIRLTYRDSDLTMLIALPAEGGMEAALEALCAQGLDYFDGLESVRVRLSLPKVDCSSEANLRDVLIALGVERAFSDGADFSDISEEKSLTISSVLQKARLKVDEDGTRAAAATAVMLAEGCALIEDAAEMKVDRPFLMLVADEATGAVCFAAAIANPAEN